jgi:enoyl-CoA hydratase/carnithine racemase
MPLPTLRDALLSADGGVATLTFNRDDVRNELTGTALIEDIEDTVEWVNKAKEISALVVTGAGKAFSAGGNVKHMLARQGSFAGDVYEVQDRYRAGIQRIPLAFERIEVPTIAAINGPAIGAGFDLACMCDLRIASDAATMAESFLNVGIVPGDGGVWFLQRLVGHQRAAELCFTGRSITAAEALRLGIVLEVVAPDALIPRANEIAASIAAKPPQALRLTKRLMKSASRMGLPDFLDACAAFQGMCHNTQDHLEAVGAMLEKRAPKYVGR